VGEPKRKTGMLWARNYGVARSKSPDPRYSFGTSTYACVKEAPHQSVDVRSLFEAGKCVSKATKNKKWDRHECLSQRMLSLEGLSILLASYSLAAAASSCA
jgi:hypothetical protein